MKEALPISEGSARTNTCEEFPDPVDEVNDAVLSLVASETRRIIARMNRLSRQSGGNMKVFLNSLIEPQEE